MSIIRHSGSDDTEKKFAIELNSSCKPNEKTTQNILHLIRNLFEKTKKKIDFEAAENMDEISVSNTVKLKEEKKCHCQYCCCYWYSFNNAGPKNMCKNGLCSNNKKETSFVDQFINEMLNALAA